MIFMFVVSYDLWFYFSHLLLHQKQMFTAIHQFHHQVDSNKMCFLDTYVGHVLESPFQGLGLFFPFLFVSLKGCWVPLFIATIIINVRGMLRHDNRMVWVIGDHHILHHKHPQYNFGEWWLDALFGTLFKKKIETKNKKISK